MESLGFPLMELRATDYTGSMMVPVPHGHLRPDAVIRSSIIEPCYIVQIGPVDVARHTIDPFIYSIRPMGPTVEPELTPVQVVHAAMAVAENFTMGLPATVEVAGRKKSLRPGDMPPPTGPIGRIFQAAYALLSGRRFRVQCPNGQAADVYRSMPNVPAGPPGPPANLGPAPAPATAGPMAYISPPQ